MQRNKPKQATDNQNEQANSTKNNREDDKDKNVWNSKGAAT